MKSTRVSTQLPDIIRLFTCQWMLSTIRMWDCYLLTNKAYSVSHIYRCHQMTKYDEKWFSTTIRLVELPSLTLYILMKCTSPAQRALQPEYMSAERHIYNISYSIIYIKHGMNAPALRISNALVCDRPSTLVLPLVVLYSGIQMLVERSHTSGEYDSNE